MTWHLVFGIQQNINISFSPTHLGLGASMVAILLAPMRSAWADRSQQAEPSVGRFLHSLLSAALAATVVLLVVQYANALANLSGNSRSRCPH